METTPMDSTPAAPCPLNLSPFRYNGSIGHSHLAERLGTACHPPNIVPSRSARNLDKPSPLATSSHTTRSTHDGLSGTSNSSNTLTKLPSTEIFAELDDFFADDMPASDATPDIPPLHSATPPHTTMPTYNRNALASQSTESFDILEDLPGTETAAEKTPASEKTASVRHTQKNGRVTCAFSIGGKLRRAWGRGR